MNTPFFKRSSFYLPAALAAGAFLLRLIAGLQLLQADPAVFAPPDTTDMATYRTISEQILNGNFPKEFYYQPFYYAVFLPLIQSLTGPSVFMVVFAQSLCGAAAVYFASLSGWMLGGKRSGIWAGILLALSGLAILYTPYRLIAVSQLCWFTLLLYLTLRAMVRGGWGRWLAAGAVLSVAILSRGNALIFLLPLLLGCFWGERRIRRRSWKQFAVCVVCILLGTYVPQLPFMAVNTVHTGKLSGPSTAGSAVLALGNTKESPPGGLEYPESFRIWTENAGTRSVPRRIFDWFLEEPLAFLELSLRKCFLFWNHYDIPNNINPEYNRQRSPLLRTLPLIPTGVLLLLALAGMGIAAVSGRHRKRMVVFLLFPLLYWLATAGFYNLGRFRLPAFGFFAIAGGLCLDELIRRFRRREYKRLFLYDGAALLGAFFLVYPGYDIYRETAEAPVMRLARPDGVQVEYPDGSFLIYDHGPASFGGWNAVRGDSFTKRFSTKNLGTSPGFVTFSLALLKTADDPSAELTVNGIRRSLAGLQPGRMAFVSLRLPRPEDGEYHILLTGAVAVIADLQRDYGRTLSGGTPMPYELLARIRTENGKPAGNQ